MKRDYDDLRQLRTDYIEDFLDGIDWDILYQLAFERMDEYVPTDEDKLIALIEENAPYLLEPWDNLTEDSEPSDEPPTSV